MECGISSQMHIPVGESEHERFMRTVEVSMAVDAAGFEYDCSQAVLQAAPHDVGRLRQPQHPTSRQRQAALKRSAA